MGDPQLCSEHAQNHAHWMQIATQVSGGGGGECTCSDCIQLVFVSTLAELLQKQAMKGNFKTISMTIHYVAVKLYRN